MKYAYFPSHNHVFIAPQTLTKVHNFASTFVGCFPASAAASTRLSLIGVSASRLRVFHLFRMGGHDLPIDALRRRRPPVPRLLRFCDMCHQRLVGDEQHFVFLCTALQPLRDAYSHLFPPGLHSLKRFINNIVMWQEDLSAVVHFISDAFSFRLSLLGGQ